MPEFGKIEYKLNPLPQTITEKRLQEHRISEVNGPEYID
jgi:hypothetical protein